MLEELKPSKVIQVWAFHDCRLGRMSPAGFASATEQKDDEFNDWCWGTVEGALTNLLRHERPHKEKAIRTFQLDGVPRDFPYRKWYAKFECTVIEAMRLTPFRPGLSDEWLGDLRAPRIAA